MNNLTTMRASSQGLSLVELMVAMVIGGVVMLGAANLFVQNKISYIQDEELARLQESARYGVRYIGRELSMSGFYGGVLVGADVAPIDPNAPLTTCYQWILDTEKGLEHLNNVDADGNETGAGGGTVNMPSDCLSSGEVQVGTDILVFRRVFDTPTVDQTLGSNPTPVDGVHYLRIEDYNVSISMENTLTTVESNVDLWQYSPQILFVRNASAALDGIPSLCRMRISQNSEEMANTECLLQGVEDFQVEFGIGNGVDYVPEQYQLVPTEFQMQSALSARFYLLMRSPHEITGYTNDKSYTLGSNAGPSNPGDGFYRKVFQSTVTLRNSEALGI